MTTPRQYTLSQCHHCGRIVARQTAWHTGKGRVRHKCPHGLWCSAGHPRQCGNNLSKSCRQCSRLVTMAERDGKLPWPRIGDAILMVPREDHAAERNDREA